MQVMPIDLTELVAIIMGVSVVLIPIMGLTARFALKPTVEALSRFFEQRGQNEALQLMERRCALLEQQVEVLEHSVHRLSAAQDFHEQLSSGESSAKTGS